jgi:hypothetical protein
LQIVSQVQLHLSVQAAKQPACWQGCLHWNSVQFGGQAEEQKVVLPSHVTLPRSQTPMEQSRLMALQAVPVHEMSASSLQSSLHSAILSHPEGLRGLLAVAAGFSPKIATRGSSSEFLTVSAGAGSDSRARSTPLSEGDWAAAGSAQSRRMVGRRASLFSISHLLWQDIQHIPYYAPVKLGRELESLRGVGAPPN